MPDDVGGQPFPDGEEPDYRDRGAADDEFASVVLDEDFVRAARVHEPSAVERVRAAAAQSHAEHTEHTEHADPDGPRVADDPFGYRRGKGEFPYDDPDEDDLFEDDPDAEAEDLDRYDRYDRFGRRGAYGGPGGLPPDLDAYEHGADFGYAHGAYGPYAAHDGVPRPYRGHRAWQRPVAWVLAVVMGIGVVALAFSAVYRGGSSQRQEPAPPPASTGVESAEPGALPTATAEPPGG